MGAPFDGKRFRNQAIAADRSLLQVLRWATSGQRKPWPRWVENRVRYEPAAIGPGQLAVTFVNHATFLIQSRDAGGRTLALLTDPVWAHRASPLQWLGPARVRHPGVPFDQLPRIDVVVVSHNHYDHMDLVTLRRLDERFGCEFVTARGNERLLAGAGIRRVAELDWDDRAEFADGAAGIIAAPAQHFSARTPFDRNRALWASFAIQIGGWRLFFAGDSGYHAHFADIGARLGPFDAALIPIGAYEPRWFMSAAHMNPDEAVRAHLDLRSRLSVGMHFGCFQLTDEAIDDPVRDLGHARDAHGVPATAFRVLEPGETLMMG